MLTSTFQTQNKSRLIDSTQLALSFYSIKHTTFSRNIHHTPHVASPYALSRASSTLGIGQHTVPANPTTGNHFPEEGRHTQKNSFSSVAVEPV